MSAAESLPAASPEPSSESLAANLDRARERIARAATRAGRSAAEIQLVCVSKTMPAERVIEALHSGATAFGENYVQEARGKIPLVNAAAMGRAIEWHLIGHLQTNKAKYCPDLFSVVQSIDSLKLAEELAGEALKKSKPALRVLVEVNLSENPGRAGVAAQDALTLCEHVAQIAGLKLEGLMGVAPYGSDPEEARPHFRHLRSLWEQLPAENRRTLSMGMSGDFETAIEEGATLVRIGTAIFGERHRV